MVKECYMEEVLLEVQEAERLVVVGPGSDEVSLSSECGGVYSLFCC